MEVMSLKQMDNQYCSNQAVMCHEFNTSFDLSIFDVVKFDIDIT